MKNPRVLVVFPSERIISNWVRFECYEPYLDSLLVDKFLSNYTVDPYTTRFTRFLHNKVCRNLKIIFLVLRRKYDILYWIKPNSWIPIYILNIFRVKNVIDVNDPYHLPELLGERKFRKIIRHSYLVVFESEEYCFYVQSKYRLRNCIVIEDSSQTTVDLIDSTRESNVVWVGSTGTSSILLSCLQYLKHVVDQGYCLRLLGVSEMVERELRNYGLDFYSTRSYEFEELTKELSRAAFSFVPAQTSELWTLRGNLKAKISMSFGAVTIAQRIPMHERLISDMVNGILFENFHDFVEKLSAATSIRPRLSISAAKMMRKLHHPARHAREFEMAIKNIQRD